MKKTPVLIVLTFLSLTTFAQKVINYHLDGNNQISATDFLEIKLIETHPDTTRYQDVAAKISLIPGVLGSLATIGIDAYTSIHNKRMKKFTATYANSNTFILNNYDYNNLSRGDSLLLLTRYSINNSDEMLNSHAGKNIMAQYYFRINKTLGGIELSLVKYTINYSKAKIKNNEKLAVGIDFKLSQTLIKNSNIFISDQQVASNDTSKKDKPIVTDKIKSDSTKAPTDAVIKIPAYSPGKEVKVRVGSSPINKVVFPTLKLPGTDWLMLAFTVTVTEVNINHNSNSTVNDLLTNHSSDVSSIIKAIFPTSSSSKN